VAIRFDRRSFVALTTSSAAAVLTNKAIFGQSRLAESTGAWRTDPQGKHVPFSPGNWKPPYSNSVPDVIVDASRTFQPILGFGAALTDSSCYLLSRMPADQRSGLLADLYSPEGMNLSVGRCCIGSSDYATKIYNYDDVPGDTKLEHFSITQDEQYILPILRQVRAIRPDLFLHASSWSPPGWMKIPGSMLGGWMDRDYLGPFATYMLKFLAAYQDAGVPIQAICTQNEVETDQHGMMPACIWTPQMEAEFIRDHFGPRLRADKRLSKTDIWVLDYNYILWKRVDWQLKDARLASFVGGVAFHGYEGQPEQMEAVERRYPDMPIYFTEWSSELKSNPIGDWAQWAHDLTRILENGVRNITLWNLLLDENGKPEIGPFDCVGVVTLNSKTGELERNGQYWALYHFSAHVKRGARRIHSQAGDSNFTHIAFVNPDGEQVLVLSNQSYPRSVQVQSGDSLLEVPLSANSITTVTWRI
jgi:glucosylceramidase